jgi:hypothetical protein
MIGSVSLKLLTYIRSSYVLINITTLMLHAEHIHNHIQDRHIKALVNLLLSSNSKSAGLKEPAFFHATHALQKTDEP